MSYQPMKSPFSYEVVYCGLEPKTYYRESGIGFAESYSHAANQIEEFYGTDLVAIHHLELYEENTLLPMSPGLAQAICNSTSYKPSRCDVTGKYTFIDQEDDSNVPT